jgi:hypothetical protein
MPSGKKFGDASPSQSIEAEEDIELLFNRVTDSDTLRERPP